ncbi:MAG TPA: hypothetical protein DCY14_15695 [Anaerolineae bacterium]|nr:hypothetical protein [Anaerolineae bacterium]HRJ56416.1 hypothetical protein [Anaerolineales bacterium]
MMNAEWIDYFAVLLLGAMIGFVEILARYKDAPFKVAFSPPGLLYIFINAGVSGLALWGVRLFGIEFGSNPNWSEEAVRWLQVGVSGLSAMTLFRSSLFNFRVDEQDISVGPNAILQILLVAVDKEVDRLRGSQRARIVEDAMEGITFEDAVLNLPPVILGLMQNLTDKDRNEIVNSVEKSLQSKAPERSKTMTLGLSFINVVGEDILKAAIDMANLDKRPKAEMSAMVGKVTGQAGDAKLEGAPQTPPEAVPNLLVPLEAAVNEEKIAPAVDKLRKKLDKKAPKPKTAAKS